MVNVTKLPPGRAQGAGDLQAWASNRLTGRSGSGRSCPARDESDKGLQRQRNKPCPRISTAQLPWPALSALLGAPE
jgi:hypothetical protein